MCLYIGPQVSEFHPPPKLLILSLSLSTIITNTVDDFFLPPLLDNISIALVNLYKHAYCVIFFLPSPDCREVADGDTSVLLSEDNQIIELN